MLEKAHAYVYMCQYLYGHKNDHNSQYLLIELHWENAVCMISTAFQGKCHLFQ